MSDSQTSKVKCNLEDLFRPLRNLAAIFHKAKYRNCCCTCSTKMHSPMAAFIGCRLILIDQQRLGILIQLGPLELPFGILTHSYLTNTLAGAAQSYHSQHTLRHLRSESSRG